MFFKIVSWACVAYGACVIILSRSWLFGAGRGVERRMGRRMEAIAMTRAEMTTDLVICLNFSVGLKSFW